MKIDKTTTFFTIAIVISGAIYATYEIVNHNLLEGLAYIIIAILLTIIYTIYVGSLYINNYNREVELLREDLANLNDAISAAFDKVDTNFKVLVEAIDDFAAEIEGKDR